MRAGRDVQHHDAGEQGALEARGPLRDLGADAERADAAGDELGDGPEGLGVQRERDRRVPVSKLAQRVHERGQREHVVDGDREPRLDPVRDAVGARAQAVDRGADRARLGGQLVAGGGQLRLSPAAVEERRAQLSLEVGHAVAHGGLRALQRARGGREAARVDDGQKEPQLVEGQGFGGVRRGTHPSVEPMVYIELSSITPMRAPP